MTSLIQEIEAAIEEKEKEKKKEKKYKPKQETVDKIGKRMVNEDYAIYHLFRDYVHEGQLSIRTFFREYTGVDPVKIGKMSDETKKIFQNKIRETFQPLKIDKNRYFYFFNDKVKSIKERVKLVTQGDISGFHFITEKEAEEYFNLFKRFTLLCIDDLLGFSKEDHHEKVLEVTIEIICHPYTKSLYVQHYLCESGISASFKNGDLEKLKNVAYKTYQKTEKKYYESINPSLKGVKFVEDRLFLFNEKEKKKLKDDYFSHYKEVLEKRKNNKKTTIEHLEEIKKDVENIMSW